MIVMLFTIDINLTLPGGAGTRIFQHNLVSTMAADALALIATSPLATMIKKDSNHLHCLKFEKW